MSNDDLRPEYQLSSLNGRSKGKYASHYHQGTNLVLLDPDVAEAFPTETEVNQALRGLMRVEE